MFLVINNNLKEIILVPDKMYSVNLLKLINKFMNNILLIILEKSGLNELAYIPKFTI